MAIGVGGLVMILRRGRVNHPSKKNGAPGQDLGACFFIVFVLK